MIVDENFFNAFEKGRQREQIKLRQKIGGTFNLSQKNFTAMLAVKNFKFQIPKRRPLVIKRMRRKMR